MHRRLPFPPDWNGLSSRILIDQVFKPNTVDHFLLFHADGRTLVVKGADARAETRPEIGLGRGRANLHSY